MTVYTEADIKVAARNWAAFDRLLADAGAWPRLRRQFDHELRLAAEESVEDADDDPRLPLVRLVPEAHRALLSLAALATRSLHRLPPGQRDAAPPTPIPCPRGPRYGDRCVWTALRDPDPRTRPWFLDVLDRCALDPNVRFCVVSQLCVRGAWDFADVLAVERAARYALTDWAAPLLRLNFAVFGRCPYDLRASLTRELRAEDPLDRLVARAHLAAIDDDWCDLFAHPSVLEYRRLWSLQPDLPPPWARH